ncbi:MAG: hypothetical protein Fues2KO_40930 [Fuerstiella sp.]
MFSRLVMQPDKLGTSISTTSDRQHAHDRPIASRPALNDKVFMTAAAWTDPSRPVDRPRKGREREGLAETVIRTNRQIERFAEKR